MSSVQQMDFWCVVRREKPSTYFPPRVFWQQLKGSRLRGLSRPKRRNRGAETPAPHTDTNAHRHGRRGHTHTHTPRSLPRHGSSPSTSDPTSSSPPIPPLEPPPLGRPEKQAHLVNKWHVGEVGECLVRTLQGFSQEPSVHKVSGVFARASPARL